MITQEIRRTDGFCIFICELINVSSVFHPLLSLFDGFIDLIVDSNSPPPFSEEVER